MQAATTVLNRGARWLFGDEGRMVWKTQVLGFLWGLWLDDVLGAS